MSFEYDEEWLKDLPNNVSLDPDLRMFKGRQYAPADKSMFGVFEDSCPDRWGRLLMKRREAIIAKKEERKPRTLTEIDFLLRKLESASLAFEKNNDGMEEKWLRQLIAPGSSLGGARPKASVLAPDGSLWIAKFPSKHDEINVGAWEMVVHDLTETEIEEFILHRQ